MLHPLYLPNVQATRNAISPPQKEPHVGSNTHSTFACTLQSTQLVPPRPLLPSDLAHQLNAPDLQSHALPAFTAYPDALPVEAAVHCSPAHTQPTQRSRRRSSEQHQQLEPTAVRIPRACSPSPCRHRRSTASRYEFRLFIQPQVAPPPGLPRCHHRCAKVLMRARQHMLAPNTPPPLPSSAAWKPNRVLPYSTALVTGYSRAHGLLWRNRS